MRDTGTDWSKIVINAAEHWRLSPDSIELVSHSENIVFKLTSGDVAYAVRIHNPDYHGLAELNSEHLWVDALHESGVEVPAAVKALNGEYFYELNVPGTSETRQVSVVEWLDGSILSKLITADPDSFGVEKAMYQLGRIAGAIHNQSSAWEVPEDFRRHALDADGLMGSTPWWGPFWDLPELKASEREQFERVRERLYDLLSGMNKEPDHFSMIHADLHDRNIIVHGDELYVIDFDDAGFGWHIYELAVALHSAMNHPRFTEIERALIDGYRSVRSLDQSQIELLPVFLLIRSLAIIGWMHQRPHIPRDMLLKAIKPVLQQVDDTLALTS